jgi:2,3-bisphosphoglycerate-independent phosphoglycerate mutase
MEMTESNMDMTENNNNSLLEPDSSEPVKPALLVIVIAPAWGIGPSYAGNVFIGPRLKNYKNLIANYPLALLRSHGLIEDRYASLGGRGFFSLALNQAAWPQVIITDSEAAPLSLYYFTGGREDNLSLENWRIIPSHLGDRTAAPEQAIKEITKVALKEIRNPKQQAIIVNFDNLNLMAESGDLSAAREAVAMIDKQLGRLLLAVSKQNGTLVFTAPYGRAECLWDLVADCPNQDLSDNPVPFIIYGEKYKGINFGWPDAPGGDLSLVEPLGDLSAAAPTILKLLGLAKPTDMPGESLIN